jgi:glucose-1-phosphate cytidylyltransferase
MKVVILAGGRGIRITEETSTKPKPMVLIGGQPILWYIMKLYAYHGFAEFVIALGYKGDVIKDYFLRYQASNNDLEVDLASGNVQFHKHHRCDWKVRMIDTGMQTLTGGRIKRLESLLRPEGTFMLTYGDGLSDIHISRLLDFHRKHGKLATITAVRPPARFGTMTFDGDLVAEFKEKPQTGRGWINGGFFVFEPDVFDYLKDDTTILERDPLERLAVDGQLVAYKHDGFWQCMDTMRDKIHLEELYKMGNVPWIVWE